MRGEVRDLEVSMIVPVYNMEAGGKLAYCLDSLLAQKNVRLEILAVDDCSTDGSARIIRRYMAAHPAVVKGIFLPENRRQGGAKNAGLAEARGEWVGFVDSDDWISPEFCSRLLEEARRSGADVVGCEYQLTSRQSMDPGVRVPMADLDQCGPMTEERRKNLLLRFGSLVTKLYRREVIERHGLRFPEGIFYEDNCAGPIWACYFSHYQRLDTPLYYYYQHGASTVHRISEAKCLDRMQAGRLMRQEAMDRGLWQKYAQELGYLWTELFYKNTLFSYMQGVERPRLDFVRRLRQEWQEAGVDLEGDAYCRRWIEPEELYWMRLQAKSDWAFFWYYRAKLSWRRWRKRGR